MNNLFPRKFVKDFKRKAIAALDNKEQWEKISYERYAYNLGNLWCCAELGRGGRNNEIFMTIGKEYPQQGSSFFLEFQFFYLGIVYFKIKKMAETVNMRDFYANLLNEGKEKSKETVSINGNSCYGVANRNISVGELIHVRDFTLTSKVPPFLTDTKSPIIYKKR